VRQKLWPSACERCGDHDSARRRSCVSGTIPTTVIKVIRVCGDAFGVAKSPRLVSGGAGWKGKISGHKPAQLPHFAVIRRSERTPTVSPVSATSSRSVCLTRVPAFDADMRTPEDANFPYFPTVSATRESYCILASASVLASAFAASAMHVPVTGRSPFHPRTRLCPKRPFRQPRARSRLPKAR
jgi:hypothetical protein